ncbi:MAG: endonuclease/exonuclease/phosphatase family protein [bacterium]|nr:endonuclease/exonuclease/phosphatase family protein [bacterium]
MRLVLGLSLLVLFCLAPAVRPAQAQGDCPAPLRIVTWNIENFNMSDVRDDVQLKTLVEVIAALDADILALQEIGNLDAMETLLDAVEDATGRFYVYAFSEYSNREQRVGFVWDDDVVALQGEAEEFRDLALSGGGLRPGFHADFVFNGYDFTLFVVHLKALRDEGSTRVREAQAMLMAQWLEERPASADEDVIFLGDFNDDFDSESLAPFASEVDFVTDELPRTAASYIGGEFRSLIDHIAVTTGDGAQDEFCGLEVFDPDTVDLRENIFAAIASDHLPLIAEFATGE